MTYRDDHEGLRARVKELEGELDVANETIERLRGEAGAEAPAADEFDAVTGLVKRLHLERELPVEVSDEGLLAIANLLSARMPGGTISQIAGTLTHSKANYELRLSRTEAGRTKLQATFDYRQVRMPLGLGMPEFALLGSVLTAGVLAGLRFGRAGIAVGIVLGALVGFALLRAIAKRAMTKDRQQITAAFEAVVDLAARHGRAIRTPAGEHAPPASDEATAADEGLVQERTRSLPSDGGIRR